jgi:hypothetical protein
MSHEHHGPAIRVPRKRRNDVVHKTGMKIAVVLDGADSLLDANFTAERAELFDQIFPDSCGSVAPDRMRLLRDVFEVSHCSCRGKPI